CSGYATYLHLRILDATADNFGGICGQRSVSKRLETFLQRTAIAESFPGRCICRILLACVSEQFVGGSDDVLDLRAGLRFQYRDDVDQDAGVGKMLGGAAKRRERLVRLYAYLEQIPCFKV